VGPDLEKFFELTPDVCCVLGWNGTVQASNAAWLDILGYSRGDIHGTAFIELIHPDERKATEIELARHVRSTFTARTRGKDDRYRVLRWQTAASLEERKVYAIGRAEALPISRSERLMSLGQMALGVVHDLKNVIVHPLALQLQRMERAMEAGSKDRERAAIAAMRDVLRDGVAAIDRLLRPPEQTTLVNDVDVDPIVWRAVEIGRAYARSLTGEVMLDWQPGSPQRIAVDTFDLLAALVNLIFNAIDAVTAQGGTVTVKSGDGAKTVWLTISDNGPGIDNDVRARIFEPFFTTKSDGVGLGLSIVQACVDRHAGSIRVITAPSAGTTMRIELPVP